MEAQRQREASGGRTLLAPRKVKREPLLTHGIIELTGVTWRMCRMKRCLVAALNVWRYAHFDKAIRLANNNTRFGLSCGLVSTDRAQFEQRSCWRRGRGSLTGINRSPGQRGVLLRRLVVSSASGNHRPRTVCRRLLRGRWPVWNLPN